MQQERFTYGQEGSSEQKPVECLGRTFDSEEQRREYFRELLREKLADPAFRAIAGFPLGSEEDILALSDPPYYTACPNPFLEQFIAHYGKPYDPANDAYRREPFAADVSEGKNDPIYNAHSYHTKVPHKAIMRYILHYTEPGDLVFDGFCGTGMTGVAAQLCGDQAAVTALGYTVLADGTILDQTGRPFSRLGERRAILNDLSPAATFIAYNYNTPVDIEAFEREARRILAEVEAECGWMYETEHSDGKTTGRINYTVWSDVFVCPNCFAEVVFWEAAVDKQAGKVNEEFPCPHCAAMLTKRRMERAWVTKYDSALKQTIRQAKQVPVLINYSIGKKRFEKTPDAGDLALIEQIERAEIPYWFPTDRMPEGDESRRNDDNGITHVHHFYTKRNLWVLGALYSAAKGTKGRERGVVLFFIQYACLGFTKLSRYVPTHYSQVNQYLSGTLYIGSQQVEVSPGYILSAKLDRLAKRELLSLGRKASAIQTENTSGSAMSSHSYDYIFTDPPFGGNLMYSELNFLWEAWLKVFTNNKTEAVVNSVQGKGLPEYQQLMTECFREYYRVLKPGRWMTVEFHNSKNSVWNAIQEALQVAGFVIADVRTLDKQQGSFKQVTSANAVKQDLVISCYKPNGGLEQRFQQEAGTEEGVWDFVRTHLKYLPVYIAKDEMLEIVVERQKYLLYDRMVAYHVRRGVIIPLSAAEFYQGLERRFPVRDEMYFLPDQVAEYDKKRMSVKGIFQLQFFVADEISAIQWLKQQLARKPSTFQEIQPEFLKQIGGWYKHEKPLELSELLEQNFLRYEGKGPIPDQIISWMKQSEDLRAIIREELASGRAIEENGQFTTDSQALINRAKDHWYIPDPNKASDLEKLRERALLREFESYRQSTQRRLRVFRFEAIRAGFKKAWQDKDYATIIAVADKIPETILQEDTKLLMWYDQAVTRAGGQ